MVQSFVWWGLLVIAVLSFVVVVLFVLGGFVASSSGLWWFRLLVVDVSEVVPSPWAKSREGCVRRTSSAAQSGEECRGELADHRGTSRVQVTCYGLVGPVRSSRSRVIKTQAVQPDPLVCEGVFFFWAFE